MATSPSPSYGPAVPDITALAYRARIDFATTGRFQVRVQNTGSQPFTVLGVALDSPGFDMLPATPLETVFDPGAVIDLRTPYGAVICEAGLAAEPAYAILDLRRTGGAEERVRAPMPSQNEAVSAMHDEDCAAQAIATAVTVTLAGLVVMQVDGAPTVTGTLQLRRSASGESIAIVDLLGSVVLQVRTAASTKLPVEMAADTATLTVPIQIRQATCDPHYLADVKTPLRVLDLTMALHLRPAIQAAIAAVTNGAWLGS